MIFMFPEVIRRQVLPRQTNNYSYGWSSLSCNRKELQTVETNQHVTTLIPHLFWIRFQLLSNGSKTQNPIELSKSCARSLLLWMTLRDQNCPNLFAAKLTLFRYLKYRVVSHIPGSKIADN